MITDQETQQICANIVTARKSAGLKQREVTDRLNTYYTYTLGSYRCLEARAKIHNIGNDHYRVKINKRLINALSRTLEVPVDDLAPPSLYASLPDEPRYRIRNAPKATETAVQPAYVHDHKRVAERLRCYMIKYGHNARSFCNLLRFHDQRISESHLRAILRGDQSHVITHDLLDAATAAFNVYHVRDHKPPFTKDQFLICDHNCPHCQPWKMSA